MLGASQLQAAEAAPSFFHHLVPALRGRSARTLKFLLTFCPCLTLLHIRWLAVTETAEAGALPRRDVEEYVLARPLGSFPDWQK